MHNITAIKNYILFLKREHNLSVSLHPLKYDSVINSSELSLFNMHDNSYCVYIKNNSEATNHCVCTQKMVLEKCRYGSYCGICYAGVKEFVYPITNGRENVGFISVSGYKTEKAASYQLSVSKTYDFNLDELKNIYDSLQPDNHEKAYIDTLILPLCDMLELAYLKAPNIAKSEKIFAVQVADYIKCFRNQEITSKEICEHFSCSRSYMSTEFNKYFGKTIREYITELRIADAKSLLTYSSLSVTEIAYCIGFSDANYFSSLFKKLNKITPLQYRKASRK